MRPDGTRVKDLPPLVAAIPYIMPKRYDAWNSVTENIDEEVIKDFIRTHRRAGVRLDVRGQRHVPQLRLLKLCAHGRRGNRLVLHLQRLRQGRGKHMDGS